MLVMLIDNQILAPQHVCQGCLLATQSGQPRWHQGKLGCGQAVTKSLAQQPDQYECIMGFRIADIK